MDINIKKILDKAVMAPSGDNCQPWLFKVRDNTISVFNVPDRDRSLFNFRQIASYVAIGAAIENIMITSPSLGYKPEINVFPDRSNPQLVAIINLVKSDIMSDPLEPYIAKRTTNRKYYRRDVELTDIQRNAILDVSKKFGSGNVKLIEGRHKDNFSKIISVNDKIVFENPSLHRFLFDHIRWTEEEAQRTRDGLYIKTLEIHGLKAFFFRSLKNWALQNILNRFGLSFFISKQAEMLCRSASAIGIIAVEKEDAEGFVKGGRIVQRVWLEATRNDLSFQPITGITFLIHRVAAGETTSLSDGHVRLIMDVKEKIKEAFDLMDETIVMLFRVGVSDPPSAISLRIPSERVSEII